MKSYLLHCLVILLFISSCESPVTIPEKGISQELATKRKSFIDRVKYSLFFEIPENKSEDIKGKMNLSLVMMESSDLVLDFYSENGKVDSILVLGKNISFIDSNQHIIIPRKYIKKGEVGHEFEIYFTAGNMSLNRNDDFLYTLFVPARASTVFPLFDQPDIKAQFQLTLEIPLSWKAQTNGSVVKIEEIGQRKRIEFSPSAPIPSYLFAFSAGKFDQIEKTVNGRKMALLHRETDSLKVKNNLEAIFELHASALNWLETYTGIKYPFEKFAFTLVPSFQYGGMEHPGAIFYNAGSLFLEENASVNQKLGRASLIAHETAHMWFGDLVTMKWFNDVWLKEVFANFMAAKIVNPQFPELNHDLRFIMAYYRGAYEVDRTSGSHPVRQTLDNLSNAGSIYGAIIYQKAPILMKHLEMMIGEDAMQKGLGEYLNNYSYGNATWDALVKILDNQTDHDVTGWSEMWVYGKGMPQLNPIRGENRLVYEQNNQTGSQKVQYYLLSNASDTIIWEVDPALEGENTVSIDKSTIVWPNATGFGYGYFKMDSLSLHYVLRNVGTVENPVLRAATWINLFETVLRGDLKPFVLMDALYQTIPVESEDQILSMLLGYSEDIYWHYLSEENRNNETERWEELLWELMEKTDRADQKLTLFRSFRSMALTKDGIEKLVKVQKEDLKPTGLYLSENDKIGNVSQLALKQAEGWEQMLQDQYELITNADRKKRMAFVMPALSDKQEERDQFFESLKMAENREQERWV
ncbi:MAG: M1 family aminopeptidase, partial [Cyclobacteriaceae bacterium]|nr:M1 family aminopeptidase [Cyclobacteriaceae bacterium]